MDAGEKENAATMVSSSDGIASKMNMEITEGKTSIILIKSCNFKYIFFYIYLK